MTDASTHPRVADVMARINRAWLGGTVDELRPLVHPDVVMAIPGFSGSVSGRERLLAGFTDFCANATVHDFQELDTTVDEVGDTAVVSVRFAMLYERAGERHRSTGRDLWVFQRDRTGWVAVWRTMLDLTDDPA